MAARKKYYSDKLSAGNLKRCYEIAPARVKQYLEAEIEHVVEKINPSDTVLELGCGYGRILEKLCMKAQQVYGIDTSLSSLMLANLEKKSNRHLFLMDAVALGFRKDVFDIVICIQNGISAFNVDRLELIREGIRVARSGGIVLFSSYSEKFWNDRLAWFELQAKEGLLGKIDHHRTGDGVIVCKDGFKATTVSPAEFISLTSRLDVRADIIEVDQSSLFCEILVE